MCIEHHTSQVLIYPMPIEDRASYYITRFVEHAFPATTAPSFEFLCLHPLHPARHRL